MQATRKVKVIDVSDETKIIIRCGDASLTLDLSKRALETVSIRSTSSSIKLQQFGPVEQWMWNADRRSPDWICVLDLKP